MSLFSGAGFGDLGLTMAGMEIVGQVEIDDYCQKILKLRWPDVPKWRDIKSVRPEDLPSADLISGGPPCQPVSIAGKRRGKEDDRWLWPEMVRIIESKKSNWVLYENPPGIITLGLDEVLSDLDDIGYTCQTFNIPAGALEGEHKRFRIFVFAYHNNIRCDLWGFEGKGIQWENKACDEIDSSLEFLSYAEKSGLERSKPTRNTCAGRRPTEFGSRQWHSNWRKIKPGLRGMDDAMSNRVDRLKALGNGQDVSTVYEIGRLIMEFNSRTWPE